MTDSRSQLRVLGDALVPAVGFGAMRLGLTGRPGREQAIQTVHAALDAGARVIDTAVNYCDGASEYGYLERLVSDALASWAGDRDSVVVVCKGGVVQPTPGLHVADGTPRNLRASCEITLRALRVESVGLYLLHAVDPAVPLMESVGALVELQQAGKIQRIGLSNVGRRHIEQVRAEVDVAAVENQLSIWARRSTAAAQYCGEHAIPFLAWGPLGAIGASTERQPASAALTSIASARGVSTAQLALAWVLTSAQSVIAIPGARRPETIRDSLGALSIDLTPEELVLLDTDR